LLDASFFLLQLGLFPLPLLKALSFFLVFLLLAFLREIFQIRRRWL